MESSQDARSEGDDSLHSIITNIADGAENVPESDLDEGEFQMVATEHGSFKRKPEHSEDSRKMSKDDLEPDVKFIIKQDIDAMAVQMFTDGLPEDGPFQLVGDQVLDHDQTEAVYQQLSMQEPPSSAVQALQGSIDSMDVTGDSSVPMPQVALGLIPAKDIASLQPMSPDQINLQFQKKLDDLEKQVNFLQNRNLALEESYKKLSDLVEAQNHLLASGGPFIQRPVPVSRENSVESCQTHGDATQREAPGAPSAMSTPKAASSNTTALLSSLQQPPRPGLSSYELPRRVSAKEVLSLWEHGSDEFPPLKDWTPTQKLKQQSKISRWKKLVDIFKNDYNSDMKSFEESFSDAKGEILPVTTILSLYETQQTPAFLGKTKAEPEDIPIPSPDISPDVDDATKKSALKPLDSEVEDMDDSDGHAETKADKTTLQSTDGSVTPVTTEVRYPLPRKVTPNDIVRLWEEGCDEFPPVSQWSRAQKIGQETKIFRWRKISEIFNKDSNRNWEAFYKKYTNDRGHLLAISSIIAKYDAENATSGPIFDRPEAQSRLLSTTSEEQEDSLVPGEVPMGSGSVNGVGVKVESSSPGDGSTHILPRKVTAKDIIKLWETGYGDLPPLHQWTPAQKAGQRSKFSRWTKIYDIYKYHCKGDLTMFESKFSDERGELYPVTTIVAMFDAWESPSSLTSPFTGSQLGQKSGDGSETEIYQLPRKVTAKDVVQLWEEGCELFPPVSKWPKIHKVGHETKLFRWKKIVDIFRKDCSGSWEKFEERFSNSKGELLPISAILSKYDLENEPTSFLPKNFSSSLNRSIGCQKTEASSEPVEDKDTGSDSDTADEESASLRKGAEFILPKKVTALDVIYLWENGLGDMPPLCQWTPTQKASQRSKISRWNKVVDIFKYECASDIRKFEEKYRDEKGDLLPITNILSLHDAQDKPL